MSAQLLLRGATSGEISDPGTGRPFGETPRGGRCGWIRKFSRGQRVLDGLSGARAGGRAGASAVTSASAKDGA